MEAYAAMDKLSYDIFSLLESKFLFGPVTPARAFLGGGGRVRVLSIDGCGAAAEDALLAAAALARLEAGLRKEAGDPGARVAEFFDVAAGAGAGGVLAALLLLRGADGRPRYSAEDALAFVAGSVGKKDWGGRRGRWASLFRGKRVGDRSLRRVFGDATLRDTVAPLLVPCYDLATAAPFMFSRADAVEGDAFDFRLRDVCAATCAAVGAAPPVVMSVDGRTAIAAASAGVAAMGNPTAAAVTHVLHNKQEFPLAASVDDILVLSIGTGTSPAASCGSNTPMLTRSPSPRELARVTAEGVADMVDESVAMAFGHACGSNYVRVQAGKAPIHADTAAAAMLAQRNVESVLFRGRRLSERTNAEKVDALAAELAKEQQRRRRTPLPNVAIKRVAAPSPRLSSATTVSSATTTPRTTSTMPSPRLSSATTVSSATTTPRTTSTMPSPASYDSRRS
jgi:patatin-like phospholipase/acyl hydrolase